MIEGLEKLLAAGKDNALLRFGLGKAYLDAQNPALAAEHLTHCVAFDAAYTAAWKLLGKARQGAGATSMAPATPGHGASPPRKRTATVKPRRK